MGNIKGVIVLITLIGLVSTMLVIAEKKARKRYNYTIQTELIERIKINIGDGNSK